MIDVCVIEGLEAKKQEGEDLDLDQEKKILTKILTKLSIIIIKCATVQKF